MHPPHPGEWDFCCEGSWEELGKASLLGRGGDVGGGGGLGVEKGEGWRRGMGGARQREQRRKVREERRSLEGVRQTWGGAPGDGGLCLRAQGQTGGVSGIVSPRRNGGSRLLGVGLKKTLPVPTPTQAEG
ncbi:unnamed protein product [Eretmochelys imbricata]